MNANNGLSPVKKALIAVNELQQKIKQLESNRHEPIAIIGVGAKFPKANNVNEFWSNLVNNIDCITEVPNERWNIEDFYSETKGSKGKLNSRYGGFIDDFDKFDASFFGISPREALQMDPQQRILLEISWQAFENANILPSDLSGTKTGVFIGISSNDYSVLQAENFKNDPREIDAYLGTGNSKSIAANRLSYYYNFQGPSIAIDTACSSSLVAVHLACQSLKSKESDLAVAGGVNLILSPYTSISFSQAQMLSPSGKCKSFDSNADGYVRSEAAGVIVLKRLSDALTDGDNVLAVIKGSAINQDGKTNGLTAPNSLSQIKVIQSALKDAKISIDDIDFIETHGTGTILGDPIEIQALIQLFKERSNSKPCYLGAVKTNIGHSESAAGIAGIIKTAFVLKNGVIPSNLHFNELNKFIDLKNSNLTFPTNNKNWKCENGKRVAGVSSFGFGGTNAHIILEEAEPKNFTSEKPNFDSGNILCLSAENEFNLKKLCNEYLNYLETINEIDINDICYNANNYRQNFGRRISIVFKDKTQLSEALKNYLKNEFDHRVVESSTENINNHKIGFLFTGQGSQYQFMAKKLYDTLPSFANIIDSCFNISDKITSKRLKDIIFNHNYPLEEINETEYTQPSLFIIEYSIAKLLLDWGIQPDFLLGHSIGELTAACIAEVFTLEEGIKLTVLRGKLMQSLPKTGMMVSIYLEEESVANLIKLNNLNINIGAINGKKNIVISGKNCEIYDLLDILNTKNINYKILKVSHAFHSELMDPILDEFEQIASSINYKMPQIPIISNLTGNKHDIIPDEKYWKEHLRSSVRFIDGMETLAANNCNLFVEVGPNPVLTAMGKTILSNNNFIWIETLKRNKDDWENLLYNLGSLFVNGININWKSFYKDFEFSKVQIPSYQFTKERFFVEQKKSLDKINFSGKIKIVVYNAGTKKNIKIVDEKGNVIFEQFDAEFEDAASIEDFNKYKILDSLKRSENLTECVANHESLLEKIKPLSGSEKHSLISKQIKLELAKVLKINPNVIVLDKSITLFGLDSIMSIELKNKIEQSYNILIPIVELIKGPTLSELTHKIILEIENGSKVENQLEPEVNITEYDLSYGQNALWFQQQLAPEGIFNPTYAAKINSKINIDKLKFSINELLRRHPILRSNFIFENGKTSQKIKEDFTQPIIIFDCNDLTEKEIKEKVNNETHSDFNLIEGNIFKVNLFISRNESIILISAHHIAVDFWSLAIIVNELLMIYNYDLNMLGQVKNNYYKFVKWQRELLNSDHGEKLLKFWLAKLDGELPNLNLPTKQRRKPVQSFDGNVLKFAMNNDIKDSLIEIGYRENATLYMVLFSIYNLLLFKYTNQNEIIVGSPTSGRTKPEFNDIVGYFVNPIALRTNLKSSDTYIDLLIQTKTNILEAIAHQDLPFNYIVEKLKPERDPSRTPIFQVMFVYQKAQILAEEGLSEFAVGLENAEMKFGDLNVEYYNIDENKSIFDMTFIITETKNGLSGSIVYNKDLFDENFIKEFFNNFSRLSKLIIENSNYKISNLKLVEVPENSILDKECETFDLNDSEFVHNAFEQQVINNPNKLAVQFKNESISYFELNSEANKIANYLLSKKLKHETKIGVFIERSFAMIKSILGIMKAGFVYVPIDTIYPEERIFNIISDADIHYIISQEKYCDKLHNHKIEIICIDKDENIKTSPNNNPNLKINPFNLAYSIYTSGSTGIPKGVLLTHIGLSNLVKNQTKIFEINENSVVLQFASLSFDASVSEIFTSLVNGATLQLVSNDILLSGTALINELNDKKVSVATIPPSLLAVIPFDKLQYLRTLVSAGEMCTQDIVKKWSYGRKFINAYGPTEITVCATTYVINGTPNIENIPIGKSINGISCYIFDQDLNLVPKGVIGELYIGGIGVARGYNKLPELTAEKFIPNPYAKFPGERLYKTGDVVKLREDGNFEFFGRSDDQIKFRGFRIELKEIKTVLENHGNIKASEIILKKLPHNEKRLIAFYISNDNEEISKSEFREYLVEHLPDYMIPSNFIRLEEIPLTTNGKVNKKFLEEFKLDEINNSFFENPQSEIENDLTNIWQNVLQLEKISRNDNFFDLGGHSLNVIQVQSSINEKFGKEISVVDFFKYPTIKLLGEFIQNGNQLNIIEENIKGRVNQQKQKLLLNKERMKKGKLK